MATFDPPYSWTPALDADGSFFALIKIKVGATVLKTGTSYRSVTDPTAEEVEAADIAYLGGHTYQISSEEATNLTNAGYQVTP